MDTFVWYGKDKVMGLLSRTLFNALCEVGYPGHNSLAQVGDISVYTLWFVGYNPDTGLGTVEILDNEGIGLPGYYRKENVQATLQDLWDCVCEFKAQLGEAGD